MPPASAVGSRSTLPQFQPAVTTDEPPLIDPVYTVPDTVTVMGSPFRATGVVPPSVMLAASSTAEVACTPPDAVPDTDVTPAKGNAKADGPLPFGPSPPVAQTNEAVAVPLLPIVAGAVVYHR